MALAEDFHTTGERHPAHRDLLAACATFAEQCERHAEQLRPQALRYGIEVREEGEPGAWQELFDMVRHRDYEVIGHPTEAGLRLLRDLRQLFLTVQDTSIRWVIVGEAAQAGRDMELLAVVRECHAETESQVEWLTTRIKVAAQTPVSE